MAEAFQRQVIYGGTLDTILLEMDVLEEPVLVDALGRAASLPTVGDVPSAEQLSAAGASQWFPYTTCERYRAVPISLERNVLRVLVTDPPDRRHLDELGYMLSLSVDPVIVPEHRFMQAVELVYHVPLPARFASLAAKLRQRALEAPVVPVRRETSSGPVPTVISELRGSGPLASGSGPVATASGAVEVAAPTPVRAVVTDVPMPPHRAGPTVELGEMPTPRVTTRQMGAPAVPISDLAVRVQDRDERRDHDPLSIEEALRAIDNAPDRDAIFSAVCRAGRSQLEFVALFTVHGAEAVGRLALCDDWVDHDVVARIAVPLGPPSGFHAAVEGHAPYLGRIGDEPIGGEALRSLGREPPLPALLLPIVLRERAVAVLYGDASGAAIDVDALAALSRVTAAAARSFQRLILKQKGGEYSRGPHTPAARLQSELPTENAPTGAWHRPDESTIKERLAPAAKAQPVNGAPRNDEVATDHILDLDALVASVICGDDKAPLSGDALITLGERGALAVVARLPGPLKLARDTLRGPLPPLAEHGPLLALLARFGKLALPALLARVTDPAVDVRYYAALALGELRAPEAVPPLGQRLLDGDAGVRQAVIAGLQRFPASPELRTLTESLRGELPGPDGVRQQYAAEALGALRDAPSVPRLIELVKHHEPPVAQAARRALVEITKQDFGASRWRWRSWWERHRNEPRVEWMLEGLGHPESEVRLSASEELRALSAESFGYHADQPRREREEARKRWIDWWRTHGNPQAEDKRT
jgi:hypothetical protein